MWSWWILSDPLCTKIFARQVWTLRILLLVLFQGYSWLCVPCCHLCMWCLVGVAVSLLIHQQRINQMQRFRISLWLTLCSLLCMWCRVGVAIFLLILQQRINWLRRLKSFCGWCVTDLSKNRLSEMPVEVCEYSNMERLNCYHNIIKSIPEAIVQLQALTHLNLRFVPRQPPPFILLCLQSSSSLSVS